MTGLVKVAIDGDGIRLVDIISVLIHPAVGALGFQLPHVLFFITFGA